MINIKKLLILICVLISLTGCATFSSKNNITELLSAPVISQEEASVIEAIKTYLGENITLRYSQSLGYTSPVQFIDIDNNQQKEAVAFYYAPNKGANVRIALLAQTSDKWNVIMDKEGLGTDVFFFDKTSLENLNGSHFIVGYTTPTIKENFVVTYFTDRSVNIPDFVESCKSIVAEDVTNDGNKEIIITNQMADGQKKLRVLKFDGHEKFEQVIARNLSRSNIEVTQIKFAKNSNRKMSIYIDYKDSYNKTYTEIGTFENGKINFNYDYHIIEKSWEYEWPLLSVDIDNDGIIEVPTVIQDSKEQSRPVMKYIEWTDYSEGVAKKKKFGVCDTQSGLFIALPEEWQNHIYAIYRDQSFDIYSAEDNRPLINVRTAIESDESNLGNNISVTRVGTKLWSIKFSQEVENIQIEYILKNIISLK